MYISHRNLQIVKPVNNEMAVEMLADVVLLKLEFKSSINYEQIASLLWYGMWRHLCYYLSQCIFDKSCRKGVTAINAGFFIDGRCLLPYSLFKDITQHGDFLQAQAFQ
jgi:hypothetical protein